MILATAKAIKPEAINAADQPKSSAADTCYRNNPVTQKGGSKVAGMIKAVR